MHNERGFYRGSFVPLQHIADTADAVTDLAARLAAQTSIALDTEFLRERTYRAELCLIQVSAAGDAVCIDPIAVTQLGALAGPLTADGIVKVMHASRQDLEVLLPAVGLVRPVFDTQIAAALAGFAAQIGYAELARRLLGIELPKAHTRTDWSRRPLSPEQIEYALDDVRHLVPLKLALEERLEKLGRLPWLAEELEGLAEARSLTTEPEEAWRRLKGLRGLDPARERLARGLAAWRERRAMERNRPRGWILEDAAVRELIVRVPRSRAALEALP
ncbi:MAG TPA: HRDC domain-containing protein, partial [Steroidobacteraceae bacterium]|nr:HRDC domain-containing protein [Steroidobacteraceae bacterium]